MVTSESDLKMLLKALAFAAHKHSEQRRKDVESSPYINHPIALAEVLVNEAGIGDVDTVCAALLHDTVEDTDTTLEELEARFGARISGIVAEVTDDGGVADHEQHRYEQCRHQDVDVVELQQAKRVDDPTKMSHVGLTARSATIKTLGSQRDASRLGQGQLDAPH